MLISVVRGGFPIFTPPQVKSWKKKKNDTYQYYAGNMVYNNVKLLDYLLFDEGLVTKTSSVYSYEYHLKDHLGNTRVTFQPDGNRTTTTQVADYYPFGSSYLPISPAGSNKYLYNGKERQDDVLGSTAHILSGNDIHGATNFTTNEGKPRTSHQNASFVKDLSAFLSSVSSNNQSTIDEFIRIMRDEYNVTVTVQ